MLLVHTENIKRELTNLSDPTSKRNFTKIVEHYLATVETVNTLIRNLQDRIGNIQCRGQN